MTRIPFSRIDGDWRGQTVNVIGAGTSLYGFDFDCLDGIRIGCNKVALEVRCDVLFSLDHNFARRFREEIQAFVDAGGEAILALPATDVLYEPAPGATYVLRHRANGLSDNPGRIFGHNSGYGALGLAYMRRAARVRLLGLDMRHGPPERGETHFHGGYGPGTQRDQKFLNRWAGQFIMAAAQCRREGVDVVNYVGDPDSLIDCFPKVRLEDLD